MKGITETFKYLLEQQGKSYPGSTSIHPRVVGGKTIHKKVNTCKTSKKGS